VNESPSSESVVEAAIARVLDAEVAARDAVAATRVAAAAMAEQSRAAARGKAERTQRRIAHLRQAFEQRAEAELAALEATAGALGAEAPDAVEIASLEAAVESLAARLTGAPS